MIDAYNGANRINAIATQQLNANQQHYPQNQQPQYQQQYPTQQINQTYREKEIITREIVKVPCPYCNQLVDITQDKCSNCGANVSRRS